MKVQQNKLNSKIIQDFLSENHDIDITNFDFFTPEEVAKLQWKGNMSTKEQESLLNDLKILQRLIRLTDNNKIALDLHNKCGFHSAIQIASTSRHEFESKFLSLPDATEEKAKEIYNRALGIKTQAVLTYTAIAAHSSLHYRAARFDNLSLETDKTFGNLPNYQYLFGSLDFCSCSDCRSIFSPAAYFVDLMRIKANYIKESAAVNFQLQTRRPDLWELPLTCENTNNLISTLHIANKVMANIASQGNLDEDIFEELAMVYYPFNLPFNLPLSSIRLYLSKKNTSLTQLWKQLSKTIIDYNSLEFSIEMLHLSREQWDLYSTILPDINTNTTAAKIAEYYGLQNITSWDQLGSILFDLNKFLIQTQLNTESVNELFNQDLDSTEITNGWKVVNINPQDYLLPIDKTIFFYDKNIIDGKIYYKYRVAFSKDNYYEIKFDGKWIWSVSTDPTQWHDCKSGNIDTVNNYLISRYEVNILAILENIFAAVELSYEDYKLIQGNFFINQLDQHVSNTAVPIYIYYITNGTLHAFFYPRVERLHRFIRLARHLDWSFADLDWALKTCSTDNTIKTAVAGLAWIKNFIAKKDLSVAECCALIGPMKDYGKKYGTPIFQQIFESSHIPNRPENWSVVKWNVPELGTSINEGQQAIQNALAAALEIDQNNLIIIGNLVLNAMTLPFVNARELELNKDNLSKLYRLSKISVIFGFSVAEYITLLQLPGIGKANGESLRDIAGFDQNKVIEALNILDVFSQNQTQMGMSVYRLEYWLQQSIDEPVKCGDIAIQNQLLSINQVINFKNDLKHNLSLILFTENIFSQVISSLLNQVTQQDLKEDIALNSLSNKIFTEILLNNQYITADGIIDQVLDENKEKQALIEYLQNNIFNVEGKENIVKLISDLASITISSLINYYTAQQTTLAQQLAGLHHISAEQMMPILHQSLGDKNTGISILEQVFATSANESFIITMHHMQRYLDCIVKYMKLSPYEITSLKNYPEYFGITTQVNNYQFADWSNIRNIWYFKLLVQVFQDQDNSLLTYFNIFNASADPAKKDAFAKLALLTKWNEAQINSLVQKLSPAGNIDNAFGSIEGIILLYNWFNIEQILDITVENLFTVYELFNSDKIPYNKYSNIADLLWAGLANVLDSNSLSITQNSVEELKRDALVDYVINILRQNKDSTQGDLSYITNERDLYEYLLIDVEVSGVVQTSRVKEAISAVQLYIYRCLNNLEPIESLSPEFKQWWSWIRNYRVWEANRKVFLYPENYIQPELLKTKSEQFVGLENQLMQNKLDNAHITSALQSYLDNLTTILNLQVLDLDTVEQKKDGLDIVELYLTAKTRKSPAEFYYRKSLFAYNKEIDNYEALEWNSWVKINLSINAEYITPIFAFNRLYIFWVEINRGADGGTDNNKTPIYEATVKYSFQNFNQEWIAPQTVHKAKDIKQVGQFFTKVMLSFKDNSISCIRGMHDLSLIELLINNIGEISEKKVEWHILDNKSEPGFRINTKMSADGKVMVRAGCDSYISVSYDGGQTWQQKGERKYWLSVAISADGKVMAVVETQGYIYVSYDGGQTWQQKGEKKPWLSIAMSADGTIQTAVEDQGYIYVSYDSGQIWQQKGEQKPWLSIAMSADGTIQTVCFSTSSNVMVAVSKDKGSNWAYYPINSDSISKDLNISMSEDGKRHTILYSDEQSPKGMVYISNNRGKNWRNILSVKQAGGYAMSWDGQVQLVVPPHGSPSLSVDSGINWNDYFFKCNDAQYFDSVSLSACGMVISIRGYGGDSGVGQLFIYPSHYYFKKWTLVYKNNTAYIAVNREVSTKTTYIPINAPGVAHELSNTLLIQGLEHLLSTEVQSKLTQLGYEDGSPMPVNFVTDANGIYYWELFFYAPFLIAHQLGVQQRPEEAKYWYEFIFNPTSMSISSDNDKYWGFLGLQAAYNPILKKELNQSWANNLQDDTSNILQLYSYHNDPFDPHAIAKLRPIAYQKAIVMSYIDNLISWGDQLFRKYTAEDIVEAVMCYVMAYDLLGRRPNSLGECSLPDSENIKGILAYYGHITSIPEFLIVLEQRQTKYNAITWIKDTPHNYIPNLYFELPENVLFVAYWDLIEQRLYNIRHSLNIEGTYKQIALFEPAINPLQIIKQLSWGEGLDSAFVNLNAEVSYYRFNIMIEKAKNMTQTVIQFGQSLLSALEKQDAEQLSRLYNTQQQNILSLTTNIKNDELEQVLQSLDSLRFSLKNAQYRLEYYSNLIEAGWLQGEDTQITLEGAAVDMAYAGQILRTAAIASYLLPNIYGLANGGMQIGEAVNQVANITEGMVNITNMSASLAGAVASYQRRSQDWELQRSIAQLDVEQINAQIVAAEAQQRIAEQNISLLNKEIEQNAEIDHFFKTKFTKQELYQWIKGQLAGTYFQAYRLAYAQAISTQNAWSFEKGIDMELQAKSFVQANYWDDLQAGLLAGEALLLNLQQMENAYMKQDIRSLEITKIVSLNQLNPDALNKLKATGKCFFDFTEKDFNYDYMGHYRRQIKAISLSFPTLLGPYQTINATLTQTTNKLLLQPDIKGVKYLIDPKNYPEGSASVRIGVRANQQVALSQGINDTGMFMLNFADERYLPFEGTGAISSWELSIPFETNNIDFKNINDVIIQLQYTAMSGGQVFAEEVKNLLGSFEGYMILDLAQQLSTQWFELEASGQLKLKLIQNMLRQNLKNYKITEICVCLILNQEAITETEIKLAINNTISVPDFNFNGHAENKVIVAPCSKIDVKFDEDLNCELSLIKGKETFKQEVNRMLLYFKYIGDFK